MHDEFMDINQHQYAIILSLKCGFRLLLEVILGSLEVAISKTIALEWRKLTIHIRGINSRRVVIFLTWEIVIGAFHFCRGWFCSENSISLKFLAPSCQQLAGRRFSGRDCSQGIWTHHLLQAVKSWFHSIFPSASYSGGKKVCFHVQSLSLK